jgi:hypothetical protein
MFLHFVVVGAVASSWNCGIAFFDTMTNSLEIAADVEGDYDDNCCSNDSSSGHNKNFDDFISEKSWKKIIKIFIVTRRRIITTTIIIIITFNISSNLKRICHGVEKGNSTIP